MSYGRQIGKSETEPPTYPLVRGDRSYHSGACTLDLDDVEETGISFFKVPSPLRFVRYDKFVSGKALLFLIRKNVMT